MILRWRSHSRVSYVHFSPTRPAAYIRSRIAPPRWARTAGEGMLISAGIMRRENRTV
jgi:hypothetical protein